MIVKWPDSTVVIMNMPNEVEQFNEQFISSRYNTLVQLLNYYVENNDLCNSY